MKTYQRKQSTYDTVWENLPLPDDWKQIYHKSGVPIYINKVTSVVTLTRPYSYDKVKMGALRCHKFPLASVPCLEAKKTKMLMLKNKCSVEELISVKKLQSFECPCPSKKPKIDVNGIENKEKDPTQEVQFIENNELKSYLSKNFEFETINVSVPNKKNKMKNIRSQENKLCDDHGIGFVADDDIKQVVRQHNQNKSIIEVVVKFGKNKVSKRFSRKGGCLKILNFNIADKTGVTIISEYCQTVYHCKPTFESSTDVNGNQSTFTSTCVIESKQYATATASSKKESKNIAALKTLEMLLPGFNDLYHNALAPESNSYQRGLAITDDSIWQNYESFGSYEPQKLLQECIKRNNGITEDKYYFEFEVVEHNKISYTMGYGEHRAQGKVKNKKLAQQQGAQRMLASIHPEMIKWGEVIDKYGTKMADEISTFNKELWKVKQQENERKSCDDPFQPEETNETADNPILEILKKEMHKVRLKEAEKRQKELSNIKLAENNPNYSICRRCKSIINIIDEDEFNPNQKEMLLHGMSL